MTVLDQQITLEQLREARLGSFERLLASYVFSGIGKAGCVFPSDIKVPKPKLRIMTTYPVSMSHTRLHQSVC